MLRPCLRPLVVFSLLGGLPALAANPNEFQVFNWDRGNDGSAELPGRLYVPDDYDPSKSYAFVTFYHGAGERGTNNTSQVNSNIDNLLAAAKSRDFFLYAPQAAPPPHGWWGGEYLDNAQRMVGKAIGQYNIDTSRLYVTGLSMGGQGTWDTISEYQGVYAAAVPICGVTTLGGTTLPQTMVGEHIWAYHARNDGTVNVSHSRNLVNAIRAADGGKPALAFPLNDNPGELHYNTGSPYYNDGSTFYSDNNLRYSEYASGNHFIWGSVYNEQPMYDWMLGKSGSIGLQAGEKVLFDLGSVDTNGLTGSDGRFWNAPDTWGLQSTQGAAIPFAKTTDGKRTAITLDVSDKFTGETIGINVPGTGLPNAVMNDAWETGSWGNNADAQNEAGVLRLLGLDPGATYNIELFATHHNNDDGRGRVTRYTINGEYYDLDIVGNTSETALFSGVLANADGTISIDIRAALGTTSRFGHVSWLSVTAVPEPASWGVVALGLAVGMRRSVRLTAGRA